MLLKLSSWFMIMVSIFSFWEFSSFFFCSWRCFQFLLSLVLSWQPLEYAVAPHQPHPQHQQSHHQSLSLRVSKRSDRIFTCILLCPFPVTSFAIKHFSMQCLNSWTWLHTKRLYLTCCIWLHYFVVEEYFTHNYYEPEIHVFRKTFHFCRHLSILGDYLSHSHQQKNV